MSRIFEIINSLLGLSNKLSISSFDLENEDIKILGKTFFDNFKDSTRNFFNDEFSKASDKYSMLLDIIWEYLNTGHWKDVSLSWKRAYSLTSFLKALSNYLSLLSEDSLNFFNDDVLFFNIENIESPEWFIKKIKEIIHLCDMGILMGAPILNNNMAKFASSIHYKFRVEYSKYLSNRNINQVNKIQTGNHDCINSKEKDNYDYYKSCNLPISTESARFSNLFTTIPSKISLNIEHFNNHYYLIKEPIIIGAMMNSWPAMLINNRWSFEYLKKIAGWRLVPVEVGSRYTEDSWSQKIMTIDEFINRFILEDSSEQKIKMNQSSESISDENNCNINKNQNKDIGYLAQVQLFDQITQLRDDILIPDYCALGDNENIDINAWFGPKGTVSPLHQDEKDNFLCQVVGQKYVRIYNSSFTDKLYPHESHLLKNTSQIDIENPDLKKFPEFLKIPYYECILSEGDMLYIPTMYWHYVKSLSNSFSVSFWWH